MPTMKKSSSNTRDITDALGKRLSLATILFHSAVAERMGVTVTDAKCRSLLLQYGPLSAGDLATHLGLTTGAVTGVIDRLVAAKIVRRAKDGADGRRVVVELVPNPSRDRAIDALFAPMGRRIRELVDELQPRERKVIFDFLSKASGVLETETRELRSRAPRA